MKKQLLLSLALISIMGFTDVANAEKAPPGKVELNTACVSKIELTASPVVYEYNFVANEVFEIAIADNYLTESASGTSSICVIKGSTVAKKATAVELLDYGSRYNKAPFQHQKNSTTTIKQPFIFIDPNWYLCSC